jgi:hypothetical protein
MGVVKFTTNKWTHHMNDAMTVEVPKPFAGALDALINKVMAKHNGYMTVSFDIPHKPRTVGKFSQNNHAWGHARQIANYSGEDVEVVVYQECLRAEKRGYPCEINQFGDRVPKPFKEASTQEANYVIDMMHEDAAFLGIVLQEE